jgi:hypothetical protein
MAETSSTTASTSASEQLASHVWRFEQLVAENNDRLRRIELLLDEIAADDEPSGRRPQSPTRTTS